MVTVVTDPYAARGARDMELLVGRIAEISTLPHVALRVTEVANDPSSGAADLTRVVESDPALCARVVRLANSAAYAPPSKISNLQQAISYAGFTRVRNLALTASVSAIFKKSGRFGPYDRSNLWKHLVSVGICARMVATRCHLPNFEDAFLTGVLHDIGIILIDQQAHAKFETILSSLRPEGTLCEVEREVLGFDHCMLGERVAEQWRFPAQVRAGIAFHHNPQLCNGDRAAVVHCVTIANVICTLKGLSSVGVKLLRPPVESCRVLGLGKDDLIVLARDLDGEIERNEILFEL